MKIITAVVNNPDFIEIQYHTLKKYVNGSYEFIVFNDAKDFPDPTNGDDVSVKQNIINTCKKLGIKCINIPNEHHKIEKSASKRCADSMNYILKYQKKYPDKYLVLDSDMFLIADFNANKYEKYNSAVILQERYNQYYIWPGFIYFNFYKLKDINLLDWSMTPQFDVGGMMKNWLNKQIDNKSIPDMNKIRHYKQKYVINNIYLMKHLDSCNWNEYELPNTILVYDELIEFLKTDPRNENGKFFCEIYDDCFLHYRAGSNWRNEGLDFHKNLTKKIKDVLINYTNPYKNTDNNQCIIM